MRARALSRFPACSCGTHSPARVLSRLPAPPCGSRCMEGRVPHPRAGVVWKLPGVSACALLCGRVLSGVQTKPAENGKRQGDPARIWVRLALPNLVASNRTSVLSDNMQAIHRKRTGSRRDGSGVYSRRAYSLMRGRVWYSGRGTLPVVLPRAPRRDCTHSPARAHTFMQACSFTQVKACFYGIV